MNNRPVRRTTRIGEGPVRAPAAWRGPARAGEVLDALGSALERYGQAAFGSAEDGVGEGAAAVALGQNGARSRTSRTSTPRAARVRAVRGWNPGSDVEDRSRELHQEAFLQRPRQCVQQHEDGSRPGGQLPVAAEAREGQDAGDLVGPEGLRVESGGQARRNPGPRSPAGARGPRRGWRRGP